MSQLDQIVKGAPPPDANLPSSVSKTPSPPLHHPQDHHHHHQQHQQQSSDSSFSDTVTASASPDPLATLPSSPPQIYLNLLILETALRSQYLALRARRRQNTFFLLLLVLWIAYFTYALFLRPREDGRGVGGSVYWVVEMAERVALMAGIVTGILIWGTGQWERGLRWPRRWLGVTNRGLRGMNAKIVVIRGPWWKEMLSSLSYIFPYYAFFPTNTSFHYVERERTSHPGKRLHPSVIGRHMHEDEGDTAVEEDLAPGGDYIKLLLLPKSFSPAFRENWDEYRSEYWEKENERRAHLRRKIEQRDLQQAKLHGGINWWTGWWRIARAFHPTGKDGREFEKPQGRQHRRTQSRVSERDSMGRSRRSGSTLVDPHNHSRTSSRSTTPNPLSDAEDKLTGSERERANRRRGSTPGSGSERSRRRKSSLSVSSSAGRVPSPLTRMEGRKSLH